MDPYKKIDIQTDLEFGGFDPQQKHYIHKYRITIINKGDLYFQLLRRKWTISDGLSWNRIVEGDGVIGQQPVIYPGQQFSYSSWCPMPSTAGYMDGIFYCIDLSLDSKPFELSVPRMNFVAMELLN